MNVSLKEKRIKKFLTRPYLYLGITGVSILATEYLKHNGNHWYVVGATLLIIAIEWGIIEDISQKLRK